MPQCTLNGKKDKKKGPSVLFPAESICEESMIEMLVEKEYMNPRCEVKMHGIGKQKY